MDCKTLGGDLGGEGMLAVGSASRIGSERSVPRQSKYRLWRLWLIHSSSRSMCDSVVRNCCACRVGIVEMRRQCAW